ncbi:ornithine carbamoyltransferase [Rhizosaccharibacter radicis]|uniref:Ornithine carbamoyltransferase n=1 Tax=Rhizosaccharibacter radicis TaxID=2782605 RepID=A0ABT1W193_9PROT|nr:ornithine carbamoyltransferase [Acetobacteraceae bacterium KSS12]
MVETPAGARPSAAGGHAPGAPRHFLDLRDHDAALLRRILDSAREMKRGGRRGHPRRPLDGLTLGLILEKPSTRTRVSFEVAMRQLGGEVVVLSPRDMQLGRGETIPDTARVLSRFLDALVLRTDQPRKLHDLALNASIPVINGLTSGSHPVQLLADILTFEEHRGPIAGRTVTWCGDGNNVATSWIEAAVRFGFTLRLATPPELEPDADALSWAAAEIADGGSQGAIELFHDAAEAVAGADLVVTDTWVSMSDDPAENRHLLLESFRVDEALMRRAGPDALFMHCLPAHRGDEVTSGVMDGPWSVVFDEAENRLHAQKGLLMWALGGERWEEAAAGR